MCPYLNTIYIYISIYMHVFYVYINTTMETYSREKQILCYIINVQIDLFQKSLANVEQCRFCTLCLSKILYNLIVLCTSVWCICRCVRVFLFCKFDKFGYLKKKLTIIILYRFFVDDYMTDNIISQTQSESKNQNQYSMLI